MNRTCRSVVLLLIASQASGCAVSRGTFQEQKYSLSDTRVCQTWVANKGSSDVSFGWDITNEMSRRGLTSDRCEAIAQQENNAIATSIVVGTLTAALLVAIARKGGGGSGAYIPPHDWDLIRDQYGRAVWTCRSTSTGQFATLGNCTHMAQSDIRWPGP